MTNFLSRDNMNINLAMTGDVEDTEYRYQVFPGYRSWVHRHMHLRNEARMAIFTPAKDKAIALILAERERAAVKTKVSSSITNYKEAAVALLAISKKQKAEVEALRAQLAAKDAELAAKNTEIVEVKRSMGAKLIHEKGRRIQEANKAKAFEERAKEAEEKLSIYRGIKVAQAAYMQVVHKVIQKVK